MKTRPIRFNGEMVRAILAGRKTQTRRLVKPQPPERAARRCAHSTGDRLWVRETWTQSVRGENNGEGNCAVYKATWNGPSLDGKWRSSIFMPRWASRITLEVTRVRVERIQDISEADTLEEGYDGMPDYEPVTWFRGIWEKIHGANAWASNPWVWVY